jgi:hypothetical protein
MTAEKTRFTPWRENGYTAHGAAHEAYYHSLDKAYGIPFKDFVQAFDFEQWRNTDQRRRIAATRKGDLYSLKSPSLFVWKSIGGRSMAHIENMGRRFTARAALDNLPLTNVQRGGALRAKPDPEYRNFLKDWQQVQWAREDAYTPKNDAALEDFAEDVPLRAVLGGMQLFTPGVKTKMKRTGTTMSASSRRRRTSAPRATQRGGRRRRLAASSCRSRRSSRSTRTTCP